MVCDGSGALGAADQGSWVWHLPCSPTQGRPGPAPRPSLAAFPERPLASLPLCCHHVGSLGLGGPEGEVGTQEMRGSPSPLRSSCSGPTGLKKPPPTGAGILLWASAAHESSWGWLSGSHSHVEAVATQKEEGAGQSSRPAKSGRGACSCFHPLLPLHPGIRLL